MRAWVQRREAEAESRVLAHLAKCPYGDFGYEISKATRLRAGRLYPVLHRLEEQGRITARWGQPIRPDGPRRRIYESP